MNPILLASMCGAALLLAGCNNSSTSVTETPPADTTAADTGTDTGAESTAAPAATAAASLLSADGTEIGTATFTQTADGVQIALHATGLTPGDHAVHIHQTGTCDAAGNFESAGGHFNPGDNTHGKLSENGPHAGDMDNQTADANGVMDVSILDPRVTLDEGTNSVFDVDGSALVIHAGPDDYTTQPTGAAGGRLACGVIMRS